MRGRPPFLMLKGVRGPVSSSPAALLMLHTQHGQQLWCPSSELRVGPPDHGGLPSNSSSGLQGGIILLSIPLALQIDFYMGNLPHKNLAGHKVPSQVRKGQERYAEGSALQLASSLSLGCCPVPFGL